MYLGASVRISPKARRDWRRERELCGCRNSALQEFSKALPRSDYVTGAVNPLGLGVSHRVVGQNEFAELLGNSLGVCL